MREYNTYNTCYIGEEMPIGYILQTHVHHVFMHLCKIDYMMTNTFMYAAISLKYNKVMCIESATYRAATIVKH